MGKETIISIVIVILIVVANTITQNYTVETVKIMSGNLEELKKIIMDQEDNEIIKQKNEEIKKIWESRHDKLAYYIEHDEVEKVETNLTGITSFIETEEFADAISELDKSNFILKHIEDKYAFNLENIF